MIEITELLKQQTVTNENAVTVFNDIAQKLFQHFYIQQGDVIFRFLEIEFYYACSKHRDCYCKVNDNKPFVYRRNCVRGGMFFTHGSGVDICFEGEVTDDIETSNGGGILLRSLLRIDKNGEKVVTGPWDCHAALFNYTDANCFPVLKNDASYEVNLKQAIRRIAPEKNMDALYPLWKQPYCYYDKNWSDGNRWIVNRYDPVNPDKTKSEYGSKPWNRMVKTNNVLVSEDFKDKVYFSNWLEKDYPEEWKAISTLLNQNHVAYGTLPHTKDYWCRDYMPIQCGKEHFTQFVYAPDYLRNIPENQKYITDTDKVVASLKHESMQIEHSALKVDGGNIVVCNDATPDGSPIVVMTEKIFNENPEYTQEAIVNELHRLFGNVELLFLPWDTDDTCGHTDGILNYISSTNHKASVMVYLDLYKKEIADEMRHRLQSRFDVYELSLPVMNKNNWAYVNLLRTRDIILMPALGIENDTEALSQIKKLYPSYNGRIFSVNISQVIKEWGGALNCLSWTLSIDQSNIAHTDEKRHLFTEIIRRYKEDLKYEEPFLRITAEELDFVNRYCPSYLEENYPELIKIFKKHDSKL